MKKIDRFEKKQRVKMMLLAKRRLTVRYLDSLLKTNNSPQIVNVLRKEGMKITTTWETSKSGVRHGVYSYVPPKKESRISNQTYKG